MPQHPRFRWEALAFPPYQTPVPDQSTRTKGPTVAVGSPAWGERPSPPPAGTTASSGPRRPTPNRHRRNLVTLPGGPAAGAERRHRSGGAFPEATLLFALVILALLKATGRNTVSWTGSLAPHGGVLAARAVPFLLMHLIGNRGQRCLRKKASVRRRTSCCTPPSRKPWPSSG